MKFLTNAWGFLIGNWKLVLAAIAAVLLSYNVGSCVGYGNGKRAMEKAIADANVKFLEQKARADAAAAAQRLADQRSTDLLERNLRDAVANIPDSVPNARRLARACAQLRSQGVDTTGLSSCR